MPNLNKKRGTAFENAVVKQAQAAGLKARRQPLSGILPDFPEDVLIEDEVLMQCKTYAPVIDSKNEKSFRFRMDWMKGVMENARKHGYRFGAVVFRTRGDTRKYVVIQYETLLELLMKDC